MKFMLYPEQKVIKEINGIYYIPELLEDASIKRVFLVCSKSVQRKGLLDKLFEEFDKRKIQYTIFEDVDCNTNTKNVLDGYQYISIKDNGIGMTKEQTERIFKRFTVQMNLEQE